MISSCLFGFETNSFENPDNEFIKHLKAAFSSSFSIKLVLIRKLELVPPKSSKMADFCLLLIKVTFPRFSKFLAEYGIVSFISPKTLNFLKDVSQEIIERRRAKLEVRFTCSSGEL